MDLWYVDHFFLLLFLREYTVGGSRHCLRCCDTLFIMSSCLLCYALQLKVAQLREGLGVATNNAAEYRALILGLKYAAKKGFKYIRAQGDSKLVCNQVSAVQSLRF